MDLALNNLQRLICHKTKQTNKPIKLLRTPTERILAKKDLFYKKEKGLANIVCSVQCLNI